jgi:RNA polymerase sigma-70 factor (TIGR02960 family)
VRAWLYRIATNRCPNALRDSGRRPDHLPTFEAPEPTRRTEPAWYGPCPDDLLEDLPDTAPGPEARYEARESLALAFVAGLQRLPPRQRAVLVLRDVLGFRAAEAAEMLESSEASVNSALQRARAALDGELPARDRDRAPLPRSPRERELVGRFVDAFSSADVDRVVALLTEDAWLKMPPEPLEYQGHEAIARFFLSRRWWGAAEVRILPTRANGQPALGYYRADPAGPGAPVMRGQSLIVLTLEGDQISAMTRFSPSVFPLFGLPPTLPA